jgi:hypothetical protein
VPASIPDLPAALLKCDGGGAFVRWTNHYKITFILTSEINFSAKLGNLTQQITINNLI